MKNKCLVAMLAASLGTVYVCNGAGFTEDLPAKSASPGPLDKFDKAGGKKVELEQAIRHMAQLHAKAVAGVVPGYPPSQTQWPVVIVLDAELVDLAQKYPGVADSFKAQYERLQAQSTLTTAAAAQESGAETSSSVVLLGSGSASAPEKPDAGDEKSAH